MEELKLTPDTPTTRVFCIQPQPTDKDEAGVVSVSWYELDDQGRWVSCTTWTDPTTGQVRVSQMAVGNRDTNNPADPVGTIDRVGTVTVADLSGVVSDPFGCGDGLTPDAQQLAKTLAVAA